MIHHPQRAHAHGAIGVQPVVPVVRWVDLDEAVWDRTVFSKNRARLLEGDMAQAFLEAILKQAREGNLLSDEHLQ